jgi:hypothetical protein
MLHLGGTRGRGIGNFGLLAAYTQSLSFSHYIGLQVGSTYNIADLTRKVPLGLSISIDSNGDFIIQHKSIALDVTLIGTDTNPPGLLAALDAVPDTKNFPNAQKLKISIPTYMEKASWEYIQPPGLIKSMAQGVASIGAWLGETFNFPRVMPAHWIESINYIPVEKGYIRKQPSDRIVPCTHSSANNITIIDPADIVPERDDEDDSDPEWNRPFLKDNELSQPEVISDTDFDEESDNTQEPISVEDNSSSTQDPDTVEDSHRFRPLYPGFNGDGDGGVGVPGYRTWYD